MTLLKELKKNPHRVVAARVCHPENKTFTLCSENDHYQGQISDIHLSEQYTNGSFVVDVTTFGEIKHLEIDAHLKN